MRIFEKCKCGGYIEADDQPFVLTPNDQRLSQAVDRGQKRYDDKSGTGYAADFVREWRKDHACGEVHGEH